MTLIVPYKGVAPRFLTPILVTLWNMGLMVLIGWAIWLTSSIVPLLALFFMKLWRSVSIETECPSCQHKFTACRKKDDD